MRKLLIAAVITIGTLSGVAAVQHARSGAGIGESDHWREIAWPFPRDGWPAGRAFRCDAAACGEDVELYVRPKIGFCNCDSGVADDDEVDRVADLDLMSQRFVPIEAGNVIRIAEMSGRSRSYDLAMADGTQRCKVAIQTNNVETDERGYIYIVDRANTGLHILELTGPARTVAGLSAR